MSRATLRQAARRQLLGDRIEAALQHTPIPKMVRAIERVTGWDCGCAKRTEALNRWDAKRRANELLISNFKV